ncbi:MAG TPA: aminotransferase class V-fold PLP-dependent enzyme [Caldilineae bacterium]|nr:aminotransferase class V-fold PLP-dependent enzyme [Caldilineae bacterium]
MNNQQKNEAERRAFLTDYPAYGQTVGLDELRRRDFTRLDEQGHTYLDYTGGGLYAISLVEKHARLLEQSILGNPHSQNPASLASTHLVDQARADVLRYFNADPEEYLVIFTANASGALKLLAESYPFDDNGHLLLVADNHNSVHGIREFAHRKNACVTYVPLDPKSLRIDEIGPYFDGCQGSTNTLFAFPAQSNFSGVQHPLDWIERAHGRGFDVLLDAAAFVPTNRLDLQQVHPDYVPVSFYKMFGYPTGVGAMLARKEALAKLQRPWFAGGTVQIVSTKADLYIMADEHEAFEEGTVNYLNLPAISTGLQLLQETGIDVIHERVMALTAYLLTQLQRLSHSNGQTMVELYGPTDAKQRGGTIAFNLLDPTGVYFPFQQVEAEANQVNISIRAGCFCNPGAGEYSLTHVAEDVRRCVEESTTGDLFDFDAYRECLGDKATGAVRASLGLVSNFKDVSRFLDFLAGFRDRAADGRYAERGC